MRALQGRHERLLEIMERVTTGQGKESDLELLETLSTSIKVTSLCGLGQTAPNPVLSTLKYFREEFEAHISDKKCPAKVCKELITTPSLRVHARDAVPASGHVLRRDHGREEETPQDRSRDLHPVRGMLRRLQV